MVATGGLEVDLLVGPPHRPVDLPDQLAVVVGGQVGGALEAARGAGVGQRRGGVVVRRRGDGVATALAAVGAVGEAGDRVGGGGRGRVALLVVLVGDRVREVGGLLLGRVLGGGDLPGAVLGEHRLDLVAAGDGLEDLLAVGAGGVHLRLGDLLHLDAELAQRVLERRLEVVGPAGVALPRVGHGGQRAPDVVGPLGGHAGRHLAEPVEVVPRVEVAHRHAAAPQLLGHEVRGDELAQVAQVDGPARGGTGRDGHQVALARVAYGVVRRPRHPVDRIALPLPSSCHARKARGRRMAPEPTPVAAPTPCSEERASRTPPRRPAQTVSTGRSLPRGS